MTTIPTQDKLTTPPVFATFELAFDWVREINHPARFIVLAEGTKSHNRELWRGFPSGRGEFICTLKGE